MVEVSFSRVSWKKLQPSSVCTVSNLSIIFNHRVSSLRWNPSWKPLSACSSCRCELIGRMARKHSTLHNIKNNNEASCAAKLKLSQILMTVQRGNVLNLVIVSAHWCNILYTAFIRVMHVPVMHVKCSSRRIFNISRQTSRHKQPSCESGASTFTSISKADLQPDSTFLTIYQSRTVRQTLQKQDKVQQVLTKGKKGDSNHICRWMRQDFTISPIRQGWEHYVKQNRTALCAVAEEWWP